MPEGECCLICLDPVAEEMPLQLLDCGCKNSWFHPSCEHQWLSSLHWTTARFLCPMCRRPIGMQTNYCFAWTAGPEQLKLWFAAGGLGLEVLYVASGLLLGASRSILALSSCSTLILILPFVSPRLIWTFDGYVFHLLVHLYGEAAVAIALLTQPTSFSQILDFQLFFSGLHFFLLYLVHIIEHRNQWHRPGNLADLFDCYAISREIHHVRVLEATTGLPVQPVAGAAEGDEGGGLRGAELPARRGGSRRRGRGRGRGNRGRN